LGFSGSRFYARALAELITSRGRDALMHAVEMSANNNLEVIYGDTDSIMVYSGTEDLAAARKMADMLKKEVNKHYRCMEIDIDGVMKSMLLLKKKKYAALMVEENNNGVTKLTRETKGLDLVRRDWCTLSREVGSTVLDFILSGAAREEVVSQICEYLRSIAQQVAENALGIESYIITKALTKSPHDYPDAKSQPHVTVAKAMLEQGQTVAPGAVIEYVICEDTSKSSVAERAHHPKTVLKAEGLLQIDSQWYLAQQLHPPIWRLCEPIEGIDSVQVAECLGLDPGKFAHYTPTNGDATTNELLPAASDAQRFADSKPLSVRCLQCKASLSFRGVLGQGLTPLADGTSFGAEWVGAKTLHCKDCGQRYEVGRLRNALCLAVRKELTEYYTSSLQCEEPSCRETSRALSTHEARDDAGMRVFPACTVARCKGKMLKTYSDRRLHNQLLYFRTLFDLQSARNKMEAANKRLAGKWAVPLLAPDEEAAFIELKNAVGSLLSLSAYNTVDCKRLFASGATAFAGIAESV
jgi:DNA polymerase alpha subunit A